MNYSNWTSNKQYKWAKRPTGELTMVSHRGRFVLLAGGAPCGIDEKELDAAIEEADILYPPPGWEHDGEKWLNEGWALHPMEGGWHIYSRAGEQKSAQLFSRSDIARKWCEVRHDRVGINLRGTKPKNAA